MKKKEIWIFVNGGCITQVNSTESDLRVNLIDYDNLGVSDEDEEEIRRLEQLSEGAFIVF
jgi:hypothetical protein